MVLNISIKSIVRICFYLILIGVSITSWMKLLKEDTTFVEKVVENQPRLPSFTLCPSQPDHPINKKSIESFEDIEKAIENVRHKYRIEYLEYKPFEHMKLFTMILHMVHCILRHKSTCDPHLKLSSA
jgi:hypothetical protein